MLRKNSIVKSISVFTVVLILISSFMLFPFASSGLSLNNEATATQLDADIIVSNVSELNQALQGATVDQTIALSDNFVFEEARLAIPAVNVTIDGNGLTWNQGFLTITEESLEGRLTIKNLSVTGALNESKLFSNKANAGTLVLEDMAFFGAKEGALNIATTGTATTEINRVHFHDNAATNTAPAINLGPEANVVLKNSTLENNTSSGGGYPAGAISSHSYKGTLTINNTVFKNNINGNRNAGVLGGGGGAIAIHYFDGTININQCIFDGNETTGAKINSNEINKTYSGGAIYILDGRHGAILNINQTTFSNNTAHYAGGALFIQGTGNPGLTTTITASTFYNNRAYGFGEFSGTMNAIGGAIHFLKNGGSAKMTNAVVSSTFVNNQGGNETSALEFRGGAIGASGNGLLATAAVSRNDCLFIGNSVYGADGKINASSTYKDISNVSTAQAGTINIINVDKGNSPEYTIQDILGVGFNGLTNNHSNITAGINNEVIQTIAIKPESIADNTYVGIVVLPLQDARDYSKYNDQGATEMTWIKYDANGGTFNLNPLSAYVGTEYYEAEKDENGNDIYDSYYTVSTIGATEQIVHAGTKLKPNNGELVFRGWSTDKNATTADAAYTSGSPITLTQENVTLYAVWTEKQKHTVTYTDGVEDEVVFPDQVFTNVEEGSTVPRFVGTPERKGYTFQRWDASFPIVVTKDLTFNATWEINQYTVTYESNGGSVVSEETVDYNQKFTQPTAPTKEEHNFIGWYTDAALTQPYDFNSPAKADMTLYAKWKINAYTVTYDSNGGSEVSAQTVNSSELFTQPEAPIKEHYTFAGWYTDEALIQAYDFSTPAKADITLYAKWEINAYTVTYESNGGSEVNAQTVNANDFFTALDAPTREGYIFGGWYADEALTQPYDFNTPATADIILYAKWEPEETESSTVPEPSSKDPNPTTDNSTTTTTGDITNPSTGDNMSPMLLLAFVLALIILVFAFQLNRKKQGTVTK